MADDDAVRDLPDMLLRIAEDTAVPGPYRAIIKSFARALGVRDDEIARQAALAGAAADGWAVARDETQALDRAFDASRQDVERLAGELRAYDVKREQWRQERADLRRMLVELAAMDPIGDRCCHFCQATTRSGESEIAPEDHHAGCLWLRAQALGEGQ